MAKKNSNSTDANKFSTNKEILKVERGRVILRKGEFSKHAYRVIKGCLKSYVIDSAGKQRVLQFAPENSFIADIDSLFNETEAILFIDAVEDSEVFLLDKEELSDYRKFSRSDLLLSIERLRNNIISINKRVVLLLSYSAEDRYLDFLETYPSLVQRLPLKLIASYVGITPEFLSRIRRKMAGKIK